MQSSVRTSCACRCCLYFCPISRRRRTRVLLWVSVFTLGVFGLPSQTPAQVGRFPPLHPVLGLSCEQVETLRWDPAGCLPLRSPRALTLSEELHTGFLPFSSVLGRKLPWPASSLGAPVPFTALLTGVINLAHDKKMASCWPEPPFSVTSHCS